MEEGRVHCKQAGLKPTSRSPVLIEDAGVGGWRKQEVCRECILRFMGARKTGSGKRDEWDVED